MAERSNVYHLAGGQWSLSYRPWDRTLRQVWAAPHKRRRPAPSRPAAPAIRWAALGLPSRSLLALAAGALHAFAQLTESTLVTLRGERSEAVLGAP